MTLSNADQIGSLVGTVSWLQGLLLGSAAGTVAVLAIAALGMLMLRGRMPFWHGVRLAIGSVMLFSAAFISQALISSVERGDETDVTLFVPAPTYTPTAPHPLVDDPYAGAAVPLRR